jgi:hypothetical protein
MSAKDIVLGAATGGAVATTQTYVDDVFSTYLYTGNGSTQTINNGIDLAGKGGLVWVKSRGAAFSNCLVDTVRGANQTLFSDSTVINQNYSGSGTINNFSSTGFNVGTNASTNATIAQGGTYTAWTFRKAPKFFDIVTWTGDGGASKTIPHSLGIAPGFITCKATSAVGDWWSYHMSTSATPNNDYGVLQSTNAWTTTVSNFWNVTSTNFVANSALNLNISGVTYVAYLFAHDTSSTGIIQCGSFFTNSSANSNIQQTLGWEPQFLLIKRANFVAEDWKIIDTMRGWSTTSSGSGSANVLYPNSAVSEAAAGLGIRLLSNGFWGYPTGLSPSSTYIYMAIRRPNKPPTTGTQVFKTLPFGYAGGIG